MVRIFIGQMCIRDSRMIVQLPVLVTNISPVTVQVAGEQAADRQAVQLIYHPPCCGDPSVWEADMGHFSFFCLFQINISLSQQLHAGGREQIEHHPVARRLDDLGCCGSVLVLIAVPGAALLRFDDTSLEDVRLSLIHI